MWWIYRLLFKPPAEPASPKSKAKPKSSPREDDLVAKTPSQKTAISLRALADVTKKEVLECQAKWAEAIKSISATYLAKGDYIGAAADAAAELYGYGHSNVLFKPTKAAEHPFRPTGGEAMSYFVGGSVVDGGYEEDGGFAINGGKGWAEVVFTNHKVELLGQAAIAMGSYVFTCATTGEKNKVEYTFGYKRNEDGKARIFLHHSSVPYSAAKSHAAAPAPASVVDVLRGGPSAMLAAMNGDMSA